MKVIPCIAVFMILIISFNAAQAQPSNLDNGTTQDLLQTIDHKESQNTLSLIGLVIFGVFVLIIFNTVITYRQYHKDQQAREKEIDDKKKLRLDKKIMVSRIGLIIIIGLVGIALITIIIVLGLDKSIFDDKGDVENWFALTWELGIGVIVALSILSYDLTKQRDYTKQQSEISDNIFEIKKLIRYVYHAFNERQLRLVSMIRSQIRSLNDNSEHVMKLLDLWLKETDVAKKKIRETTLTHDMNSLKNYLSQSTLDEIKDVGNRHLSATYGALLTTCNLDSSYYDLTDSFEDEMIIHFTQVTEKAIEVINALQKYVDTELSS